MDDPTPSSAEPSLEDELAGHRSFQDAAGIHPVLAAGTCVGRYVIASPLGQGGMGIVYRAQDPQLGRAIALKVVSGYLDKEMLEDRLTREAQAMARLSHPNVVTVYDLVLHEQQLFIAMELIEGPSLAKWLKTARRWREVLSAFLEAGRGLAAVHAAGLVHRDFKPDNVLVDEAKGRVCVTDFGLARVGAAVASSSAGSSANGASASNASLTRTGTMMGTPSYMAPEQYRGEPVDARTDQFAFCVALFESLYDESPFEGDSLERRRAAVLTGKRRTPPARKDVPPRIHRVLARGMSLLPADRYPSIEALLHDLSRDPGRRWRRAAAILGVGVCVLASAFAARQHGARSAAPACTSPEQRLAAIWDTQRKKSIEKAFLRTQKHYAADVWRSTEHTLDAYARDWATMYSETCGARTPSAVELRRRACIEERLVELHALSDLLTRADDGIVAHAVEASESLTRVSRCNDPRATTARPQLPEDPAALAKIAEIRHQLARARVAHAAFAYKEERRLAEQALEAARSSGYRPLEAEALYVQGNVLGLVESHAKAEAVLRAAVAIAEAVGDDRTKAFALLALFSNLRSQGKKDLVAIVREEATAAVQRVGDDDELEALLNVGIGSMFLNEGKADEASPYLRKALALVEKGSGPQSVRYATYLVVLAVCVGQQGDHEEALRLQHRSLSILEGAIGPESPPLAFAHLAVGIELTELLRAAEAERHLRTAAGIFEREFGLDILQYPLNELGRALADQGRYAEAVVLHERAPAIGDKELRHDHPDIVDPTLGLGRAYVGARQAARAIPHLERALKLDATGKRLEVAEAEFLLAVALRQTRRTPARARALALDARDTYRSSGKGPRHDRDLARIEAFLEDHP